MLAVEGKVGSRKARIVRLVASQIGKIIVIMVLGRGNEVRIC